MWTVETVSQRWSLLPLSLVSNPSLAHTTRVAVCCPHFRMEIVFSIVFILSLCSFSVSDGKPDCTLEQEPKLPSVTNKTLKHPGNDVAGLSLPSRKKRQASFISRPVTMVRNSLEIMSDITNYFIQVKFLDILFRNKELSEAFKIVEDFYFSLHHGWTKGEDDILDSAYTWWLRHCPKLVK